MGGGEIEFKIFQEVIDIQRLHSMNLLEPNFTRSGCFECCYPRMHHNPSYSVALLVVHPHITYLRIPSDIKVLTSHHSSVKEGSIVRALKNGSDVMVLRDNLSGGITSVKVFHKDKQTGRGAEGFCKILCRILCRIRTFLMTNSVTSACC